MAYNDYMRLLMRIPRVSKASQILANLQVKACQAGITSSSAICVAMELLGYQVQSEMKY